MTVTLTGISFVLGSLISGLCVTLWLNKRNQQTVHHYERAKNENTLLNSLLSEANQKTQTLHTTINHLHADLATSKEAHKAITEKLSLQEKTILELQEKAKLEFEHVAAKILEEKTATFTQQNRHHLDALLTPFSEKLQELKKQVSDSYNMESQQRASLKGELKHLFELNQTMTKEAKNLTLALKGDVKTQGNWGELILETILEKSGLRKGIEFVTQATFHSEEGNRYHPDVILNLPNNKHIIIDSKVSLVAYERFFSNTDDKEKASAQKEHNASVRAHIKHLGSKQYQLLPHINSPEFVMLFMPIEPALGLAMQYDDALFYDALEKNIVLVTPSALLTTLQMIATIWKHEQQTKNTQKIAQQAGALYDKFIGVIQDFEKIDKQFKTTTTLFDSALSKLHTGRGNIISKVESLKELGVTSSKKLPEKYTPSTTDPLVIQTTLQD